MGLTTATYNSTNLCANYLETEFINGTSGESGEGKGENQNVSPSYSAASDKCIHLSSEVQVPTDRPSMSPESSLCPHGRLQLPSVIDLSVASPSGA